MKKILTLLVVIIMASCSSDDNNDVNNGGKTKYLSSFSISNGDETEPYDIISVIYDDNNNIRALIADDDVVYAYKYDENNNLVSMARGLNSEPDYEFQYTNGRLSGYTDVYEGTTTAITYNEQTKMYVIPDSNWEIGLKGRDIGVVNEINETESMYAFNYDDSRKGGLYNVKGDNLFVLNLFSELYQYVSIMPMTSFTSYGYTYTFGNTYDSDGYLTKAVLTENGQTNAVIEYQYTER